MLRRLLGICLVLLVFGPACAGAGGDEPAATAEGAEDPARTAAAQICAETDKKLQQMEWPAIPRAQSAYLAKWRNIMSAALRRISALPGPSDDPTLFRRYAAYFAAPLRTARRAQRYADAGNRVQTETIIWRFGPQLENAQTVASALRVIGCESFPHNEWQ